MRRFVLVRDNDVTGISGEGVIIWGVQFPDGVVAYRWNTGTATTCIADRFEDLITVHGHNGETRFVWLDTEEEARSWHVEEESRVSPVA